MPTPSPAESLGPHQARLTPDRLPVTWVAALFGQLVGVTMMYVPYEFQASLFQLIYPYIRLLGLGFLVGSGLLIISVLYGHRFIVLDCLGRVIFIISLAVYWWTVNIIPRGLTGAILYPLMAIGVILEAVPAYRHRGLFRWFIALVGVGFGLIMVLAPGQFPAALYSYLQPVIREVGLLCFLGGIGLLIAHWRHAAGLVQRALVASLALPFAYLAYSLGRAASWAGMELYIVLTCGCLVAAAAPWVTYPTSVRWKLLRGMVVAGLIPLLALGAMVSYLAQRAIEQQTRADAQIAVAAEAEWLEQYITNASQALQVLGRSPGFAALVAARDGAAIEPELANLHAHNTTFDTVFVQDATGATFAAAPPATRVTRNLIEANYVTGASGLTGPYITRAFLSANNIAYIALALPIRDGAELRGLLVGALSLDQLSGQSTTTSELFRVRVVDRRDGILIRDTTQGAVLQPAELAPAFAAALAASGPGVAEGFDNRSRHLLAAYAPVTGSDWVVIASQELSTVYGPITRLSGAVVFFVALAALIALLLSQVVASEVTEPLSDIQAAAVALADGDLTRRVNIRTDDELADLARAFNYMAAQVEAAQADLGRVNDELRAAIRVRDDFLSAASHELRTPLTPLKGFAQAMLRQIESAKPLDPQRLARSLRLMNQQADRLTNLVNDLLDTSRIQVGRFALDPAPMDLGALAESVAERFLSYNETPTTTIHVDRPTQPIVGTWDAHRLDQVITNLISNALRYSPDGGDVRVEVRETADAAELIVSDHGIGIPNDSLSELFQPFYRAPNAAAERYGGLGLGLFITHEIVSRHGGQIVAESPGPNQGSRFTVRLPRNGVPLSTPAADPRPPAPSPPH